MNDQKFADDKPADCAYCYFWSRKKRACLKEECHYLLPEKEAGTKNVPEGDCAGCPYGKHSPCIGYCLQKIIREMKRI